MDVSDILALRQHNQCITNHIFDKPEDIVEWVGAIQAQDFTAAKWAIGLRAKNLTDQQIEDAFNQGKILRTHLMRPTWHFILPKDIRWMLALTKARVHQLNSYYYKRSGLDKVTLEKCVQIIKNLLTGNAYATREELGKKIKEIGTFKSDITLTIALILMYAELEGLICSGPKKGKQFTYALLDERVPEGKVLTPEESLAELTYRYFQSHGPATLQDFVWWSGLTTSDARKGIALVKSKLIQEKIEGNTYWFIHVEIAKARESKMHLLPNYDEYIVGYKDRSFIFDNKHTSKLDARANPLFQHTIILDGKVIGTWKREVTKNSILLSTNIFETLDKPLEKLLKYAVNQFELYINKPIREDTR